MVERAGRLQPEGRADTGNPPSTGNHPASTRLYIEIVGEFITAVWGRRSSLYGTSHLPHVPALCREEFANSWHPRSQGRQSTGARTLEPPWIASKGRGDHADPMTIPSTHISMLRSLGEERRREDAWLVFQACYREV